MYLGLCDCRDERREGAMYRSKLEAEIAELRVLSDSSKQSRAPVTLDQQSVGRLSRMDAMQQQGVAASAHKHTSTTLQKVASALKRFETQEFGYCRKCEEPIGYGRLRAQPESALCLICQSSLDN